MPTLPQVSGPTEHALGALLDRELAASLIPDYLGWVSMNLAGSVTGRASLGAELDGRTRCGPELAAATVDRLITLGLLRDDGRPSSDGQAELRSTRRRVTATTDQLTAGIPEADLATAIAVLDQVRARAEAMLVPCDGGG